MDGLRALAFLLVFLFHSGVPNERFFADQPLVRIPLHGLALVAKWGWSGVELFYVLSAFLLTTLLLRERRRYGQASFKLFFTRRALRIWPLYFFAISLFGLVLPGLDLWPIATPDPWRLLGLYSVFLGNFEAVFTGLRIPWAGGTLWTVCMEEQFYLFLGLLLCRTRLAGRSLAIALSLIWVGTISARTFAWCLTDNFVTYHFNTLCHLDSFMAGCLLALALEEGWLRPRARTAWLLAAGMLGATLALIPPVIYQNEPIRMLAYPMLAVGYAALVMAVHLTPGFLANPMLGRVGRLTFGLYVYHYAILESLHNVLLPVFSKLPWEPRWQSAGLALGMFGLGLILTLLTAVLSWVLLEQPFLRLKKRFTRVPSGYVKER